MMDIKLATLNVNGMRDSIRRQRIFEFCRQNSFDFIFLQETHILDIREARAWAKEWGGGLYASFGTSRSCGSIILSSNFFKAHVHSFDTDIDGRVVSILVKHPDFLARLVCVYAPTVPSQRRQFFQNLDTFLIGTHPCILGGDFNCIIDPSTDRERHYPSSTLTQGATALEALTSSYDLRDVWTLGPSSGGPFTFRRTDPPQATRIDRIYAQTSSVQISTVSVLPFPFSDHDCVALNLRLNKPPDIGPGYWKCNTGVLHDKSFQADFTTFYEGLRTLKPALSNSLDWWETCKKHIKDFITSFCSEAARKRRQTFSDLYRQYRENPHNNEVKSKLSNMLDDRARGAKIRAKAINLESGERPSKAFLRSERKDATSRFITKIRNEEGDILHDTDEVLGTFFNFYTRLFTPEPIAPNTMTSPPFNANERPPEDIISMLDAPLSIHELHVAVNSMANNKSPGSDGLPAEFYKTFANLVLPDLLEVFLSAYQTGAMPPSLRHGIITLLPKNGDPLDPANRRPITLLNVDYKILAKVLNKRLSNILPYVIDINQTCAVKGRRITDNLCILRDIISLSVSRNNRLAIVSLDQEKAFDRVNHTFLFNSLHKYGLGPAIIQWVRLLYTNIDSCVMVNGFTTENIVIGRGVRQGCPLSPTLYVLCIDLFARMLHKRGDFPGVQIPGGQGQAVKCIMYADDITCFLSTLPSFKALFSVISDFELVSGSKLNMAKTKGLRIGPWSGMDLPMPIDWSDDNIKITGLWFGPSQAAKLSWSNTIDESISLLQSFSNRHLSIFAKIFAINSLIIPKFTYLAPIYPEGVDLAESIERAIFNFIWDRSTEMVKRQVLYLPTSKGGVGLTHLRARVLSVAVSYALQVISVPKPGPLSFLFRYMGAYKFRKWFPHLWTNNAPHTIDTPPCHQRIHDICLSIIDKVPSPSDLPTSSRELYKLIFPIFVLSTVHKDHANLGPNPWWGISSDLLDGGTRDLSWRIMWNALKVKSKLRKWGITDSVCPRPDCNDSESIAHLFWDCPTATYIWDWLSFFCLDTQWTLSKSFVLYGGFAPTDITMRNVLWTVVSIAKSCLWGSRNKLIFERTGEDNTLLLLRVKQAIRLRIKADLNRWGETKTSKFWGHKSLFATFENDKVGFNF